MNTEPLDDSLTVCVTHRRFVPCRRDDGTCVLSNRDEDVDAVNAYQRGDA